MAVKACYKVSSIAETIVRQFGCDILINAMDVSMIVTVFHGVVHGQQFLVISKRERNDFLICKCLFKYVFLFCF